MENAIAMSVKLTGLRPCRVHLSEGLHSCWAWAGDRLRLTVTATTTNCSISLEEDPECNVCVHQRINVDIKMVDFCLSKLNVLTYITHPKQWTAKHMHKQMSQYYIRSITGISHFHIMINRSLTSTFALIASKQWTILIHLYLTMCWIGQWFLRKEAHVILN